MGKHQRAELRTVIRELTDLKADLNELTVTRIKDVLEVCRSRLELLLKPL